jgi:hypothetical protein
MDGAFISELCKSLSAHISKAIKLALDAITTSMSDFSPEGRHEVRKGLAWLKKATCLKDIVQSADIAGTWEYDEWAKSIKMLEEQEQTTETQRVMRRFDKAIDDFTLKLFTLVRLIFVCKHVYIYIYI